MTDQIPPGGPGFFDSIRERSDPFYRRDRLAAWISAWTATHPFEDFETYPVSLAEAMISAGWVASIAPREKP